MKQAEAQEQANSNAEIQSCPHGPTLGLPGSLTTADTKGGSKMELGCTGQATGLTHFFLVSSSQDLMQYPARPAYRASLICCLLGLKHLGTWWESLMGTEGRPLPSRALCWY